MPSTDEKLKVVAEAAADFATEHMVGHVTARVEINGRQFTVEVSNHEHMWEPESGGFTVETKEFHL